MKSACWISSLLAPDADHGAAAPLDDISDYHIATAFQQLTILKLSTARVMSESLLVEVFNALSRKLVLLADDIDVSESVTIGNGATEVDSEVHALILSLTTLQQLLTVVLRVYIALVDDVSMRSELLKRVFLPEEAVERVLFLIHHFLVCNIASSSQVQTDKAKTGKTSTCKKIFRLLIESYFPSLIQQLETWRRYVLVARPAPRCASVLTTLCSDILSMDPNKNSLVNGLDAISHPLIISLLQCASSLLRGLFSRHECFRSLVSTTLISFLQTQYSAPKSIFKPFLVENGISSSSLGKTASHISPAFYCTILCVQSLIRDTPLLHGKDTSQQDVFSIASVIVNELLLRATAKEAQLEPIIVVQQLIAELFSVCQSPMHTSALVILEIMTSSIIQWVRKNIVVQVDDDSRIFVKQNSTGRREYSTLNQFIDVLGSIAERAKQLTVTLPLPLSPVVDTTIDCGNEQYEASDLAEGSTSGERVSCIKHYEVQEIFELIANKLRSKWTVDCPLWKMLPELTKHRCQPQCESNDKIPNERNALRASIPETAVLNWDTSIVSVESARYYLLRLDALMQINHDVLEVLQECVGTHRSTLVRILLQYGATSETIQLLPLLSDEYDLEGVFDAISATDIYFARALHHIIDKRMSNTHDASFSISHAQDSELYEQRDALLSLLSQWSACCRQEHRESVLSAIALLTEKLLNVRDSGSDNLHLFDGVVFAANSRLPAFCTSVRSLPLFVVANSCKVIAAHRILLSLVFSCSSIITQHVVCDISPIVRARGVKALSRTLSLDASALLLQEHIRYSLLRTLHDRAISVREETVKLLGQFLSFSVMDLSLSWAFLQSLLPLLADEGISVRKSVILIVQEVLIAQPAHCEFLTMSYSLLERLSPIVREEESIQELLHSIFAKLWFAEPTIFTIRSWKKVFCNSASESSAPRLPSTAKLLSALQTAQTLQEAREREKKREQARISGEQVMIRFLNLHDTMKPFQSRQKSSKKFNPLKAFSLLNDKSQTGIILAVHRLATTFQFVRLVATCENARNLQLLLLVELLHGNSQGDEKQKSRAQDRLEILKRCEDMVTICLELLWLCVERNEHLGAVLLELQGGHRQNDIVQSENVDVIVVDFQLSLLNVLSLFSECQPQLLARHLVAILPFLKSDTTLPIAVNVGHALHAMRILQNTASLKQSPLSDTQRSEIIEDLSRIALQQSGVNVRLSISTMATIIRQSVAIAHTLADHVRIKGDFSLRQASVSVSSLCHLASKCYQTVISVLQSLTINSNDDAQGTKNPTAQKPSPLVSLPGAAAARLQRCLIILGHICEYSRLFNDSIDFMLTNQSDCKIEKSYSQPSSRESNNSIQQRRRKEGDVLADMNPFELPKELSLKNCLFPLLHCAVFSLIKFVLFDMPKYIWREEFQNQRSMSAQQKKERTQLTRNSIEQVQLRAAQALCGVFSGYPFLAHKALSNGMLAKLLNSDATSSCFESSIVTPVQEKSSGLLSVSEVSNSGHVSEAVQERFLFGLREIMLFEEKRLEQRSIAKQMKDCGVSITVQTTALSANSINHVDADASLIGFVLQQQIPALLNSFLVHSSSSIRRVTLSLLATLLRQGLVSPAEIIPHILSMQADADAAVRNDSLSVIVSLSSRDIAFLENRLLESVDLAFDLYAKQRIEGVCHPEDQSAVTVNSECCSEWDVDFALESGEPFLFGKFYALCILPPSQSEQLKQQYLDVFNFLPMQQSDSSLTGILQWGCAHQFASGTTEKEGDKRKMKFLFSLAKKAVTIHSSVSVVKLESMQQSMLSNDEYFYLSRQLQQLKLLFHKSSFVIRILSELPLFRKQEESNCVIQFVRRVVVCEWSTSLKKLSESLVAIGATALGSTLSEDDSEYLNRSVAKSEMPLAIDISKFGRILSTMNKETLRSTLHCIASSVRLLIQLRAFESLLRLAAHWQQLYHSTEKANPSGNSSRSVVPSLGSLAAFRTYSSHSSRALVLEWVLSESTMQSLQQNNSVESIKAVVMVVDSIVKEFNRFVSLSSPVSIAGESSRSPSGTNKKRFPRGSSSSADAIVDALDATVSQFLSCCGTEIHDDVFAANDSENFDAITSSLSLQQSRKTLRKRSLGSTQQSISTARNNRKSATSSNKKRRSRKSRYDSEEDDEEEEYEEESDESGGDEEDNDDDDEAEDCLPSNKAKVVMKETPRGRRASRKSKPIVSESE